MHFVQVYINGTFGSGRQFESYNNYVNFQPRNFTRDSVVFNPCAIAPQVCSVPADSSLPAARDSRAVLEPELAAVCLPRLLLHTLRLCCCAHKVTLAGLQDCWAASCQQGTCSSCQAVAWVS